MPRAPEWIFESQIIQNEPEAPPRISRLLTIGLCDHPGYFGYKQLYRWTIVRFTNETRWRQVVHGELDHSVLPEQRAELIKPVVVPFVIGCFELMVWEPIFIIRIGAE